ncbi:hypothetical protein CLG96_16555 [Sphingomonas oleivorans]|uniref:Cell wall hydrolase n=1 Tax=Sphingomonas oleivorans TaxID=1735121 RepID=A0A2T5FU12_9SPHN|nr:hypothetical protein CLG96_16555 [Sphingomonas oleivorans]
MKSFYAVLLIAIAPAAHAQAIEDAEHRADRLRTQQLNRQAAIAVARRDRGNGRRRADHDAAQARYERAMAIWRRRVSACQAGDYDACDDQ